MHPHSYAGDSISQSQDLTSQIVSSSTPSQIASTCTSIDSFLRSHSPDHSRHFFSLTFPTLICKLYGFDDYSTSASLDGTHTQPPSSNGWIDIVLQSNDSVLASRIFNLLSPQSVLFQSISAVDRNSLVKYVFPVERLPEWAQYVLSSKTDCEALNNIFPLFKGKAKEDALKGSSYYRVQLNVFEYFMFWFAYYPISKANSENSINVSTKKSNKTKLANWTSSIPVFSLSKRVNEHKLECNLYMRLLYAYLCAFVPVMKLNSHNPYRSLLLNYGNEDEGSVLLRAGFFVDTLVHYWLVDKDNLPFSVSFCKSLWLDVPLKSIPGETPPTPSLGEVVKLLVKYLNLNAVALNGRFDYVESARWSGVNVKTRDFGGSFIKSLPGSGSWNSWIQRPLYRYILRTFLFCPIGSLMKNASQVFSVWVMYMEPWKIGWDDFSDLDDVNESKKDVSGEVAERKESGYSSLWEDYVLDNYLYYSSLVVHFIGFAHKFLHTDPEVIVQMVLQVIEVVTSCKDLTNLIKNVDTVFHSKQLRPNKSMYTNLQRHVPSIREKLEDWENGLCESDADGSFLHENWKKDLKLFSSEGEDGGQQLLQLFILRAEAELHANSGEISAQTLQCLDSLKDRVSYLFGGHVIKPIPFNSEAKMNERAKDEIFTPRRVGNLARYDIKYKGDWMKRPISDDEIAWLAKLLVRLSTWLNDSLGLNQADPGECVPKWSYVDVFTDVDSAYGSADTMKMVVCAIGAWFLTLGAMVVKLMRRHGVRVNLRTLASKKVFTVLLVCVLFGILRKVLGVLHGL